MMRLARVDQMAKFRSSCSTLSWLASNEQVRFVAVGVFNTLIGYGLFATLEIARGEQSHYLISLYISYVLGTSVAFFLHRRITFRLSGRTSLFGDYVRFCSVYLVSLAVNTFALPLLIELGGLSSLVAQAIIVVVTTAISYFGHKYFSFRRTASTDHS